MLDFNHGANSRGGGDAPAVERINSLIDAALKAGDESQPVRVYLGASSLGDSCNRRIQLDYVRANDLPGAPTPEGEGFDGRTPRIFAAGHAFEDLTMRWMEDAGFILVTRVTGGRQPGFSVAGGRIRGHVDAVITGGPDVPGLSFPCVFEHKAVGSRSWQEIVKQGVEKARPVYAAQIAIYQAYMGLTNPALFTAHNKDTQELYHEIVPFNGRLAQEMSDRAVIILQTTDAGELMPLGASSADHFMCKSCRWTGFCWDRGAR